jgi:hypothetical protein
MRRSYPVNKYGETWVADRLAMLPDMLRQQPGSPEFLGIAQILRFLASQRNHPRSGFRSHRWAATPAR